MVVGKGDCLEDMPERNVRTFGGTDQLDTRLSPDPLAQEAAWQVLREGLVRLEDALAIVAGLPTTAPSPPGERGQTDKDWFAVRRTGAC